MSRNCHCIKWFTANEGCCFLTISSFMSTRLLMDTSVTKWIFLCNHLLMRVWISCTRRRRDIQTATPGRSRITIVCYGITVFRQRTWQEIADSNFSRSRIQLVGLASHSHSHQVHIYQYDTRACSCWRTWILCLSKARQSDRSTSFICPFLFKVYRVTFVGIGWCVVGWKCGLIAGESNNLEVALPDMCSKQGVADILCRRKVCLCYVDLTDFCVILNPWSAIVDAWLLRAIFLHV